MGGDSRSLLLFSGDAPPLPELADVDTARRWTQDRLREQDDPSWRCPCVFGSAAPNARLVSLTNRLPGEEPSPRTPEADDATGQHRRRRADGRTGVSRSPSAWVGLRFSSEESLIRHLGEAGESSAWWQWLLTFGGTLATQVGWQGAMLADPATGLPDRVSFMATVASELHQADQLKRPFAVLLINPDDFDAVNERFGRELGDTVVEEISRRLRTAIRHTDPLARYGGVIFGCVLRDTTAEQAGVIARKTLERMLREPFLRGSVRLGFSIGVAAFDALTDVLPHPLDLVRRADGALNNAKRMGGEKVVVWQEESNSKRSAS